MKDLIYTSAALLAISISTMASAQEATEIPSADEWYRTEYAPLYSDKPWDKAAALASHFTATVQIYNDTAEALDALQWMTDAVQEWKIAGWVRSEIAELEFDQLNPTTASFKTKWRDYYTGGNIGYECTWYLADYADGAWKIAAVAGIDCSEHGL